MTKKILIALLIVLIVIQFFRPSGNIDKGVQANNIETRHAVPADVKNILHRACFDCHSNNTKYPWYSKMQPVAWWLAAHIEDGKKELNFDEFSNRPLRYQYHKLEETEEQVKEGSMPLPSYTIIHKDAILTDAEKKALYDWVADTKAKMEATYPMDSLIRKK